VVVIVSAAIGGIVFSCLGQPVCICFFLFLLLLLLLLLLILFFFFFFFFFFQLHCIYVHSSGDLDDTSFDIFFHLFWINILGYCGLSSCRLAYWTRGAEIH